MVSGFGEHSVDLAARIGDGLFTTAPDPDAVSRYRSSGGKGPCYSALGGEVAQILPLPAHFEQATKDVCEDQVAEAILCEQDPSAHVERLREYAEAGYDRVVVQQVAVDQERFLRFYADAVLPRVARETTAGVRT